MSNPLSSVSEASLNIQNAGPAEYLKPTLTPKVQEDELASSTNASSSPFESNVAEPTATYKSAVASPSRSRGTPRAATAAHSSFIIREDTDSEGPLNSSSPSQRAQATQHRHTPHTSPSRKSPAKSTRNGPGEMPSFQKPFMAASQYEKDVDAQSVMSDDTCFSNFSAVPNADMTLFAKLGNRSPTRRTEAATPSHSVFATPATSKRARGMSPTPRRERPSSRLGSDDTTNLLLDFTSELGPMSKSVTEPNLLSYINSQRNPSPQKNPRTPATNQKMLNLLDFELPPQPTPRSVPSITIREVESLKSSYLSEISSLKASLSGREAEVCSLKKAVADAERRVGEAMENAREQRNRADSAEHERTEWEKKGKEIDKVLKSVKEEFLQGEREKEELQQRLEDVSREREEAELRLAEASKIARSEVGGGGDNKNCNMTESTEALVTQRVAQQLDEKMENLARELHAVYKKKHETKVATLKKTYEARSEKKCHELQTKVEQLAQQVEELQASKDATWSDTLPANVLRNEDRAAEMARLEAQRSEMEEQKARIAGLEQEMNSMQSSHSALLQELERERVEKGELVAAVDEMLLLQVETGSTPETVEVVEDFRRSISKPTGLRSVTGEPSKIGRPGSSIPSRNSSTSKSRMMSNIERMGGRGRD